MNNNEQCWPEEGQSSGAKVIKIETDRSQDRKKQLEPLQEDLDEPGGRERLGARERTGFRFSAKTRGRS